MSERIEVVLSAAYACFTRHGLRRTTMADIADEAGMSRAAVYQYVSNKNDGFRRVADAMLTTASAQARVAADSPGTTTQRLQAVLTTKLELTLRLWHDSPHAVELLDASAKLTGDLVEEYTQALITLLTELLHDDAGERAYLVAELAVAMARGLEAGDDEPDIVRQRLYKGAALLVAGLVSDAAG